MKYQSIIGYGRAFFIEEQAEKRQALEIILSQYSEKRLPLADSAVATTTVFKVIIDQMSGKQAGI